MLKVCIDTNIWISGIILSGTKKFINRILQIVNLYEPRGTIKIIPNQHTDNLILETAFLGNARYLVTGDKEHLLPIKIYRHVKNVDASNFLTLIE